MKVEGQRSDQTHSPTKSSPTSNSGHISSKLYTTSIQYFVDNIFERYLQLYVVKNWLNLIFFLVDESSRSTHASQKKTVIEESASKQANPSETSSVREKSSENGLVKSGLESEAARRSQYSGRGRGRGGGYRGRPRKDGGEFYYRNQGGYERGGYRRRGDYQNSRRDNDGRNYRPRDDYPKSAPQRGERQSNSRNERQNTAGVNERPRTAREGVKESRGGKDSNDKPQEWNQFSLCFD